VQQRSGCTARLHSDNRKRENKCVSWGEGDLLMEEPDTNPTVCDVSRPPTHHQPSDSPPTLSTNPKAHVMGVR